MSLDDHRKAVADQNPLDAGGIDQARHRVIVGGQHRDLLARRFHRGELGNRNLLGVFSHGGGKWLDVGILDVYWESDCNVLTAGSQPLPECAKTYDCPPGAVGSRLFLHDIDHLTVNKRC